MSCWAVPLQSSPAPGTRSSLYHGAIDRGRATEAIDLFTEDAVFQARGEELIGRAAIAAFLVERQAQIGRHTVHLVANERVIAAAVGEARVQAIVLLHVRQPDGRYLLERVLDTEHVLYCRASGWRIHRRLSRPLHAADGMGT